MTDDDANEGALAVDVSDEALEAAGAAFLGAIPTLMNASYCFTCAAEGGAAG